MVGLKSAATAPPTGRSTKYFPEFPFCILVPSTVKTTVSPFPAVKTSVETFVNAARVFDTSATIVSESSGEKNPPLLVVSVKLIAGGTSKVSEIEVFDKVYSTFVPVITNEPVLLRILSSPSSNVKLTVVPTVVGST